MAAMISAGRPPRVKLPTLSSNVIGEASLGKLEPFAEGASAVLFKGKMDQKKARLSNPNMMAKQQKKAELQNSAEKTSKSKDSGMVVAVKLARSREGQIHEDVEAEMKLLHALVRDWPDQARSEGEGEDDYDFGDGIDLKRQQLVRGGAENVVQMIGAGLYHDLRRFLVFEYCNSTLEELLDVAEKPRPNQSKKGGWFGGSSSSSSRPQIDLVRALKIGFELSLAVSYLHNEALPGHVVLHRDIKPSNIGLTATGSVRLLDLGLARAVPKVDMAQFRAMNENLANGGKRRGGGRGGGGGGGGGGASPEDMEKEVNEAKRRERLLPPYEMTGYTGSLRYMAPEVAVNQAYDESVDVYSLSLVLWEIASLERPYKGYNKAKFFDKVVRHKERPTLDHADASDWPEAFKQLLRDGWNNDASIRPSSACVSEELFEMTVQQRYQNSVSKSEQFEIPPLYTSNFSGASGLVRRFSEMAGGSRRGSEFVDGERA